MHEVFYIPMLQGCRVFCLFFVELLLLETHLPLVLRVSLGFLLPLLPHFRRERSRQGSRGQSALFTPPRATCGATDGLYLFEIRLLGLHGY